MKRKTRRRTKPRLKRGTLKGGLEPVCLERLKRISKGGGSVAYEVDVLPYTIRKNYVADFTCRTRSGHTFYLEVKGWFRPEDMVKMRAVKETNPDLDIRMFFASNNKVRKDSKMRYSDWCERYGFPYAIGTIPAKWFD